jgi:hypothetical protein
MPNLSQNISLWALQVLHQMTRHVINLSGRHSLLYQSLRAYFPRTHHMHPLDSRALTVHARKRTDDGTISPLM